jgi:hypothetical protein
MAKKLGREKEPKAGTKQGTGVIDEDSVVSQRRGKFQLEASLAIPFPHVTEADMSNANPSATPGSRGFPCAPSRRSVLSIFPGALFAQWLAFGSRSRAGSSSPKAPPHRPSNVPPHRPQAHCYVWDVKKTQTYSFENAGVTTVRYDEQGRVVQSRTLLHGLVEYHYYTAR